MLKDHYGILGLSPSASIQDVKKAYRRLAQELHPDKSHGDPYAKEKFQAVKEAYETLTDPRRKSLYLQERWYYQSTGRKRTAALTTPENFLQQSLELDRYVRTLDVHRMDKQGLFDHISELINAGTVEKLNEFHRPDINDEISITLLRSIALLRRDKQEELIARLKHLETTEKTDSAIAVFQVEQKNSRRWDSTRPWLVILVALLMALLIFLASQ